MFDAYDLLKIANREFTMSSTTPDEHIVNIEEQIANPFTSNDSNYFKKLKKLISNPDEMDEICAKFITEIQDIYPHLTIDVTDYENHLEDLFDAIYKFFVKNALKLMYLFIREYIMNNKNRKGLTDLFNTSKLASYPKEQYGKKEFYILVTKLSQIVDEIFDDDSISLEEFIEYLDKSDDSPVFIGRIQSALEDGFIVDNGVIMDMYKRFKKSEEFRGCLNKLEMDISTSLIIPYLKETGLIDVRMPTPEDIPDEIDDDDEEDNDE